MPLHYLGGETEGPTRPLEAGLAVLDAGGYFADDVIAFDGRWLGGETFVSFDKRAVKLIERQGAGALLLA